MNKIEKFRTKGDKKNILVVKGKRSNIIKLIKNNYHLPLIVFTTISIMTGVIAMFYGIGKLMARLYE